MTTRLIPTLGLAALLAVVPPTLADDKPQAKAPTAQDLLKQAVEAEGRDDYDAAVKLAERAVALAPDDRQALFLLGVLTSKQVDEVKDRAEKVALLHRSAATFARLREKFKALSPFERSYAEASRLGEARALALESKPEESLKLIASIVAGGFDDYDAIEKGEDLAAVRKLPNFRGEYRRAIKAGVDHDLAGFQSFPFDFELKGLDDKPVKLADYRGKVTIVDIWGTWCPPCREEIPSFVALYGKYRPKGLEIVGINCNEEGSVDEVKKAIGDFARKNKMEYRCLINDEKTEGKIPGFQGYPTTLFLDRSGKVRLALVGITPADKLEVVVATLLAEPVKD